MLIKLDDAERVVHAAIINLCLKDKDTCAGDYSAYALQALHALPVSDGWEVCLGILAEEIAGIEQSDQEDVKIYLALLYHMQDRMKAALGPLPAPPTIE